jgi:hypothetical protein
VRASFGSLIDIIELLIGLSPIYLIFLFLTFSLLSVAYLHVVHPLLGNHRDQVADRLVREELRCLAAH